MTRTFINGLLLDQATNSPEQALQKAVAAYLDAVLVPPWYYTAIGHGGGGRTRGAILKGMGLKAGVWDILILGADRFVAWIELKSARGKLTSEQQDFGEMARAFGNYTGQVRSIEDVRAALDMWQIPTRESRLTATAAR